MLAARLSATRGSLRNVGCLARPTKPPAPMDGVAVPYTRPYTQGEKNPANIAGYRPNKMDKFAMRASGKYKKGDEIPQEVSYETITATRDKLRVIVVTGMTIASALGAVWFIKKGKAERDRGETLTKRNLERRQQWQAEKEAAEAEAAK